ncbi:DUF4468 domain-containing protein [Flavobacterium tibetense]|uniref:DUF4468 domain-containing protein n=1 Tax=Flavobacterium tibetense TaxID=2233533 RepID=A0A365P4L3_9FLAO|nr:DUF4468 domain-containing protein [Flavobacterium tibetense]RBA29489.1 hypothetical protein DPN68_02255 [Flavobacterium tibetense]
MKKLFLGLLMAVCFYSSAQETEFTFTAENGMTDFIVTPIEGKTAPEIYKKVIEWIKVTYKNPDKVILSTIENEYVRFEGYSETLHSYNAMGKHYEPTKYEIEINVKDGKYKFDLISMQSLKLASSYSQGGWYDVKMFTSKMTNEDLVKAYVFKKDGTLRATYKYINEIPMFFNNLNKSLSESIISTANKSEGW